MSVIVNPTSSGKEIDLNRLQVKNTKYNLPLIRPNLLDNWYFVGGGSQQGGGQFPINQQGQTTYSGGLYTIDRWFSSEVGSNLILSFNDDSISLTRSGSGEWPSLQQKIEGHTLYRGQKITFSVLCKTTSTMPCYIDFKATTGGGAGLIRLYINSELNEWTLLSGTAVFPSDSTGMFVGIYPGYQASYSGTLKIAAMKLELGDTQTLCHNEGTETNPIWVLNEIPNYPLELEKCQRYQIVYGGEKWVRIGTAIAISATKVTAYIFLPTTLRTIPSASAPSGLMLFDGVTQINSSSVTFSAFHIMKNVLCFDIDGFSGLTAKTQYEIITRDAQPIIFNANL